MSRTTTYLLACVIFLALFCALPTTSVYGTVITHTALPDTAAVGGPIRVCATITDDEGIASATLYWSANGGPFTAVPMVLSTTPDLYYADISHPYPLQGQICYYMEATDASAAGQTVREPAAPGSSHCFNTTACTVSEIGSSGYSWDRMPLSSFIVTNTYRCDTPSQITGMEQYLDIAAPTDLVWTVQQGDYIDGAFVTVTTSTTHDDGTGERWHSSGPMLGELRPGKYYRIGVSVQNPNGSAPYGPSTGSTQSFGELIYGASMPSISDYFKVYRQKISTCRVSRSLRLDSFTGGQRVEPNGTYAISWYAGGVQWGASDTVSIHYSTDSGATWTALPGATGLPYSARTFDWNTAGFVESDHYRIRITADSDPSVADASHSDLRLKLDTDSPVITHTPLPDVKIPPVVYWFAVSASITDGDLGVDGSAVSLHWRKNGGAFTTVAMGPSGGPFTGRIVCAPPPNAGDNIEYYIEASDLSVARHITRSPAAGYHTFRLMSSPESLVELFDTSRFDLQYTSLRFTPDSRYTDLGPYAPYAVCTAPITALPTDPTGSIPLFPGDNGSVRIPLDPGKSFPFFGQQYQSFWVGSNGYITLGEGDGSSVESYSAQFARKRISAFFHDLVATDWGTARVMFKQLSDRVAVTYDAIPEHGTTNSNTFQIELFFDGSITLNYLRMDAAHGLVGVTGATSFIPTPFCETDFSGLAPCCPQSIDIADTIAPAQDALLPFGVVSVGSSNTQHVTLTNSGGCDVRFDGMQLAGCFEDFSDGQAQGWQASGDFPGSVDAGHYQFAGYPGGCALYTGREFADFYYEAKVRFLQAGQGVVYLACRATSNLGGRPEGSGYLVGMEYYQPGKARFTVSKQSGYTRQALAVSGPITVTLNDWNTIAINAVGSTLAVYLNGNFVTSVDDSTFKSGLVGLQGFVLQNMGQALSFDDIIVTAAKPLGGGSVDPNLFDGFTLTSPPSLPVTLAPGQSMNLDLAFAPQSMGQHSAVLSGGSVALSGTGRWTGAASEVKALQDGSQVWLGDKVVSAVFADRFYVQDANRVSGIGVLWTGAMPALWSKPTIDGSMSGVGAERTVTATSVVAGPVADEPLPLGMGNLQLGGGNFRYDPGPPTTGLLATGQRGVRLGYGANNIGLLVRSWGRVVYIEPTTPPAQPTWFVIEDGSTVYDPSINQTPKVRAKVLLPTGVVAPKMGDVVSVSGISSCYVQPGPMGGLCRQILVRWQSDITPFAE